ncbi:hypothetical protein JNUCC21_11340 [Bacillus sp. JNUCC-21]|uniref:hypothetical protein n=1 Tax=Bacillus TaxID=1386 RepID=UPI0013D18126|nr:hypothetical protein [Bacillus velezensis]
MTDTILAGIIGAIIGGIVPFIIYLLSEHKKKKEKRLDCIYNLMTDLEIFLSETTDLRFKLKNAQREELLSVLREVANLVSKGIFKKGRDLPYYALFIDSETYNQTMDFLTGSFEELQKIQKEFNVFKIESDEPVERIKAFVDGQLLGLDIISDKGDKLNSLMSEKKDFYYQKHYRGWKLWM